MHIKGLRNVSLSFLGGIIVLGSLLGGLQVAGAQKSNRESTSHPEPIARLHDPVVMSGSQFPALIGVPLNELALYVYKAGVWAPIPFQTDEVNLSGTLVISDDGRLDTNDELVFMGVDAAGQVDPTNWPSDPIARLSPRYAIHVTDPLSPSAEAWAYLYHAASLPQSSTSYLSWDEVAQQVAAISYTARFTPSMVGLSDLMINGNSEDILDRQKIRVRVLLFTFDEDELVDSGIISSTVRLPAVGPVRAATGSGALKMAYYGRRLDIAADLGELEDIPFNINLFRTSLDLNDPSVTGIDTYYDSNSPLGVTIDGMDDVISSTPVIDWYQVNGAVSGPGGFVIAFPHVDASGGEATNYYKDDDDFDDSDTGDGLSFADTGILIDGNLSPITPSIRLNTYILPPGTAENVGVTYFEWAENPLAASATMEILPPSSKLFLPILQRN